MIDALTNRLETFAASPDDLTTLRAFSNNTSAVSARMDIVATGTRSNHLHVVVEGWVCKYRLMSDGRRQIVSFHLPGDVCDLDRLFDSTLAYGLQALGDCRIATIPLDWIAQARATRPAVNDLFWSLLAAENLAMVEQVVALGRRSSRQRIAFLLYNLLDRLQVLGLATDGRIRSPLTQTDLADALGLSTVHVNRTLQGLREDGLLEVRGRSFRIPRPSALAHAADYDPLPARTARQGFGKSGTPAYSGASTMGS